MFLNSLFILLSIKFVYGMSNLSPRNQNFSSNKNDDTNNQSHEKNTIFNHLTFPLKPNTNLGRRNENSNDEYHVETNVNNEINDYKTNELLKNYINNNIRANELFFNDGLELDESKRNLESERKYLEKLLDTTNNLDKDLLSKMKSKQKYLENQKSNEYSRDECKLKVMEVSLNIKNCGRIIINTTACGGLCKSSEKVIANTRFKKRSCYACKAHKFADVTYQVKCIDNSIKLITLKAISACTCFKHSENILPVKLIDAS